MKLHRLLSVFGPSALMAGVVLFGGCTGGDHMELAPVSGRVTMDNKPLVGVKVTYQPIGDGTEKNPGTGSFGETDEEGRYHLELMTTGEAGAVVGNHTVSITTPEPEDMADSDITEFVDPIPPRYNFETTLTKDVPAEGTESADFALTSGPGASQ